jgi:hypothetical protein
VRAAWLPLLCVIAALRAGAEPVVSSGGRLVFRPGPGAQDVAAELAKGADEDRRTVARELGSDFDEVVDVRVAVDKKSYRESFPVGAVVPDWSTGAAFPSDNLIVLEGTSTEALRIGLRAQLAHMVMAHVASGQVPRWFVEGLAMVRSGDGWGREGPDLSVAAEAGRLMRLASLQHDFPGDVAEASLAFAQSADFVSWLAVRRGDGALQEFARSVSAGVPFETAAITHLGAPLRELEQRWSTDLVRWEILARTFAESPAWWAVLGMALAWAAARLGRARRLRARALAQRRRRSGVEHRMDDHVFSLIPALWADIPTPVQPMPHRDDPEPTATGGGDASGTAEEDEDDGRSRLAAVAQSKKPTLH